MNARPKPKFDWFIPIDGDGSKLGTLRAERPPTFQYLSQIAQTAEKLGFYSLLIPTRFANGLFSEDAPLAETWTMATAIAAVTHSIRLLVAVRPGIIPPGLFAQMASSFYHLSDGRLDINIVPGGIQHDLERIGESVDHDSRYERAEEFVIACKTLWNTSGPVSFKGQYFSLNKAFCGVPVDDVGPRLYFGGVSEKAIKLSGNQADVHLLWIEPREATEDRLRRFRASFHDAGRMPGFGLRSHVVVRNSENEAWDTAYGLVAGADPSVKSQRSFSISGTPMEGQRSQIIEAEGHRITERLWNGLSEVRVNCGTAIVGTPDQVAEELFGYWELGIDEFILSGFPHIEECYKVAEDVIPRLEHKIAAHTAG